MKKALINRLMLTLCASMAMAGCGPVDTGDLQIVNSDPQALEIRMGGSVLPDVTALRVEGFLGNLQLSAAVKPGVRAAFKHWSLGCVAYGNVITPSFYEDPVIFINPGESPIERSATAVAAWEENSSPSWIGPRALAFSSTRGGSQAAYLWNASEPGTLDRPFPASSLVDRRPALSIALIRDNERKRLRLWVSGSFLAVSGRADAAEGLDGFLLDDGPAVAYAAGGFRVSGTAAETLYEAECQEPPSPWGADLIWVGGTSTSPKLMAWNGHDGERTLFSPVSLDGFSYHPSVKSGLVALVVGHAGGLVRILVMDPRGGAALDVQGYYDPGRVAWDEGGMSLKASRQGCNVSWAFPGGAQSLDPMPQAISRDLLSPVPDLPEAASPDGSVSLSWRRDGDTPVFDLIAASAGVDMTLTTLPISEAAQ